MPRFLLGRFADGEGMVMMERRDRTRRLRVPVDEATRTAGAYTVTARGPGGPALERVLAEVEARSPRALEQLCAGSFPPTGPDRAALATLFALTLLVAHGHRERLQQTAQLLAAAIGAKLEEASADEDDESEGEEVHGAGGADEGPVVEPEVEVRDGDEVAPVSLSALPGLARAIEGRQWQLARFPRPCLLTGETPVATWEPPSRARLFGSGLGDELRIPLDPRHALIVARRADAGEVIRDLDERHARALNRTMAETARRWVYYHPGSDPLEQVELAPP